VIAGFSLVYPAWGAQQAGEIRRADSVRSNAYAMLGAEIFSVVIFVLLALLLQAHVGRDFLYASDLESSPLPVPPFLGFFFSMAGNAPIFVWLSVLMFFCWFFIWIANATLAATRGVMAASFDRVLPDWIGQVDQRVHVPVRAIAAITLLGIPVAALYAFVSSFEAYTFGLYVPVIAAFTVTMLAAAVVPFMHSRLYQGSAAARYRIGRIPLITICGLVFSLYGFYSLYAVLFKDEFGANGTKGLIVVGVCWATAITIYVIARVVRGRQGIDLSMSYKELPVE
jgi:basic amino acid/polyamine antiporter, APA family